MAIKRGRKCWTCIHPKLNQIEKDMVLMWRTGDTFAKISQRYHLSYDSLYNHFIRHLPSKLRLSETAKRRLAAGNLASELENAYAHIQKMLRACDRYLADPSDPGEYYLGPRGEDIEVMYAVKVNNQWVTKKRLLSEIMGMIGEEYPDWTIIKIGWKHADPRKLLFDATGQIKAFAETAAKLSGQISDVNININIHETVEFVEKFWKEKHPDEYDNFIRELARSGTADQN